MTSATVGNLEFEFTLTTSDTPKLIDENGLTYILAKDRVTEIEQSADLNTIYGKMKVELTAIKVNGAGASIHEDTTAMKTYAGSYAFQINGSTKIGEDAGTATDARMSYSLPSTAANVGAFGSDALDLTVVIDGSAGTYSITEIVDLDGDGAGTDKGFFFAVRGNDDVVENNKTATYAVAVHS